jgi:ubiquinone/menaquinone biosynthesis C-methylase UbiE
MHDRPTSHLRPEAAGYYASGFEAQRLAGGDGLLELVRSQELIQRHLPPAPAVVLDVGGGPGTYACWLARLGYSVHLVDAMPLHVEQALEASAAQPEHPLASATVGDARALDAADASVDAVLLMGPLYHLTEREDRLAALRERARVVRPGGVVLAVGISHCASALSGLFNGYLDDPEFVAIVERDLADGQHRNPSNRPGYFTTAFFHRPEQLAAELVEAGLIAEALLGIEGPAAMLPDLDDRLHDDRRRDQLLHVLRLLESEPALLGVSAHIMAVGRKPEAEL